MITLTKTKKIILSFLLLAIIVAVVVILDNVNIVPRKKTVPYIADTTTTQTSVLQRSNTTVANKMKEALLPSLPIEIKDFQTSVGIKTNISIRSYPNDEQDIVRIEVFGLDYLPDQNNPATNPNMVAFKESFQKVVSVLSENKVDIRDLHVSLSNKKYIRDVAESWIKSLNLLP